MPWMIRQPISHHAAAGPVIQVTANSTDEIEKTAKPMLYIRTRPYMSRAAEADHQNRGDDQGTHDHPQQVVGVALLQGVDVDPRKMSGSAINTIEELIVAIRMPRVVFDSAIHL